MFGTCISWPEGRERSDWAARCAKRLVFLRESYAKALPIWNFGCWLKWRQLQAHWLRQCQRFGKSTGPNAFRKFHRFGVWHNARSKELGPTTSRAWCRTYHATSKKGNAIGVMFILYKAWRTQLEHPISWLQRLLDTVSIYFQLHCWLLLAACTLHDTWAHMHDILDWLLFFYSQQALPSFTSALILIDRL